MCVLRHGIGYMTIDNSMYEEMSENGSGKAMKFRFFGSVFTEHTGFCHVVGTGCVIKCL